MNWYYWFLRHTKFKMWSAKQYISHTTFCVRKKNVKIYTYLLIFATSNLERINQKTMTLYLQGMLRNGWSDREWSDTVFKKIFWTFIFIFERERVCVCVHASKWKRGRDRETEDQNQSSLRVQTPLWGLNSQTGKSWPEPKSRVSRLTDWATQAPLEWHFW